MNFKVFNRGATGPQRYKPEKVCCLLSKWSFVNRRITVKRWFTSVNWWITVKWQLTSVNWWITVKWQFTSVNWQFTSVNWQFTLVKYLIPGLQLFLS